jgi:hypothetical protein
MVATALGFTAITGATGRWDFATFGTLSKITGSYLRFATRHGASDRLDYRSRIRPIYVAT